MTQNEIDNVAIQPLATDPGTPFLGQVWYNTTTNRYKAYDGTVVRTFAWLSDLVAYALLVSSPTNGDILTTNGSGQPIDSGKAFTTDGTLADDSDSLIPTEKAVKTYIDNKVTGMMDFEGAISASSNPNYPAATAGNVWYITTAGLIGGASGAAVQVGDMILAVTTNAGGTQAAVGADFEILENKNDYATTTIPGLILLATQGEVNAGTDNLAAVTSLTLATWYSTIHGVRKYTTTGSIGTSPGALTVTHNLNTQAVVVSVIDSTTFAEYIVNVTNATVNTTVITATGATVSVIVTVIG